MPNSVGKRYACEECGAVYLIVRGGDGTLHCHDRELAEQSAKPLPSSD